DPTNESLYRSNASKYLLKLDDLDSWIRSELAQLSGPKILATHHDAFGYFARDYDFEIVSLAKWSTEEIGGGTSLARRQELINAIRKQGVKAIFTESSINPEIMTVIAKETGAKLGGKLYSDAMGAKGSQGETYIGMMKANVTTLINALK
ncbi:MAG: metal ABC transporter substrate-binding protein, partial [Planctomycetota bacterium]|nr:metal ABC transporter substrate-binding protein [Planctomycetota bacterium]